MNSIAVRDTLRLLKDDDIPLEEKVINPVIVSLDTLSLVRLYLNADDILEVKDHELEAIKKRLIKHIAF